MADGVQPALGGQLLAPLGDQRAGVRPLVQRQVDHGLQRGHLQVEGAVHRLPQERQVAVVDVPAVLAHVQRDLVRASQLGHRGRGHRIGIPAAPRLPERGDMIDVDA